MPLLIQDQESAFNSANQPAGFGRAARVTATPNAIPFWAKVGAIYQQDLSRVRVAAMDSEGNWAITLPWPSESRPTTVTWVIQRSDGTAYQGAIPEGVAGSVTIDQLQTSYGWATVASSLVASPAAVIQGPPGINWRGAWSSTTQYQTSDAVSYAGNSWISTGPNLNAVPGTANVWSLLAQSGSGAIATPSTLGMIEVGAGLSVNGAGLTTLVAATNAALGGVQLDQNPSSGNPIAVTAKSLGVASGAGFTGVATLDNGGHVPLGQLSGITASQLASGAGIVAAQIASVNATAVAGTLAPGNLPVATAAALGALELDANPLSGNPIAITRAGLAQAAPAGTASALLSVGAGPFDGSSPGHFAGASQGTQIGVNAPGVFAGSLLDLQVNGSPVFRVSASSPGQTWTLGSDVLSSSGQAYLTSSSDFYLTYGAAFYVRRSDNTVFFNVADNGGINLYGPTVTAPQSPPGNASYGLLNLGAGPFDGSSAGHFVGTASGTHIAVNASSSFIGNLADWQVAGVSKLSVDKSGNLLLAGVIGSTTAPVARAWLKGNGSTGAGGLTIVRDTDSGYGGSARFLSMQTAAQTTELAYIDYRGNLYVNSVNATMVGGGTFPSTFTPTTLQPGIQIINNSSSGYGVAYSPAYQLVIKRGIEHDTFGRFIQFQNNVGTEIGGVGRYGLFWGAQVAGVHVAVQCDAPSHSGVVVQGAANQTADPLQVQDSNSHTQFAIANAGTGAAPIWALRARAILNAESLAQTHTLGAYTGRSVLLIDDAGATIGWLPLYA